MRLPDDRGAVAASAVVMVWALLLFFLIVQATLWFYGRAALTSAAHHGLEAARVTEGSEGDGDAIAEQFLAAVSGLEEHRVEEVDVGEDQVTVELWGRAHQIMPAVGDFVLPDLTVRLVGPRERPSA